MYIKRNKKAHPDVVQAKHYKPSSYYIDLNINFTIWYTCRFIIGRPMQSARCKTEITTNETEDESATCEGGDESWERFVTTVGGETS